MAEPFLGQLMLVPYTFAPRGWTDCDGQLLPISSYSALFSLLGCTYGGDCRTTFGLPDLRGRTAIHTGTGSGLPTYPLGQKAGTPTVTLTNTQIPANIPGTGTTQATSAPADKTDPKGNYLAQEASVGAAIYHAGPATEAMATGNVSVSVNPSGGQSHNNMQPYQVLRYIIALVGIYPSRN